MPTENERVRLRKSNYCVMIILSFAAGCICICLAVYNFNYTFNGIHTEATIKDVKEYRTRVGRKRQRWERRINIEYTFLDHNDFAHYESNDFPRINATGLGDEQLQVGDKLEIVYLPGVAGSSKSVFIVHEIWVYLTSLCALLAFGHACINIHDYREFKKEEHRR